MIPAFALTFVEGLLGPKFGKYAKLLIYVLAIVLLVVGLGVAKCVYDRSVVTKYQQQVQQRAAPATKQADTERAQDTINNAKSEEEAHNVIAAQPDQPISPTSRALSCKRLRDAGRTPAACR